MGVRIMLYTLTAVLLVITFAPLDDDFDSVQDRRGIIGWIVINCVWCANNSNLIPYLYYKAVFTRENASRMYTLWPYFLANAIVAVPIDLILTNAQGLFVYWVCGLNPRARNFGKHMLALNLLALNGNNVGTLLGVVAPNIDVGMEMAVSILMPLILCMGLFINTEDMDDWIPHKWVNPFRFAFSSMLQVEYDDLDDMDYDLSDDAIDDMNFEYSYWTDIWLLAMLFVTIRFALGAVFWLLNRH